MRRSRPRGDDLLTSRLITASSALLRLAKCPELRGLIDAAQARTHAEHGQETLQSWRLAWDRWDLADADKLIQLANVLSCLAVPDEDIPWVGPSIGT